MDGLTRQDCSGGCSVLIRDHTGVVQVTHQRGGDGDLIEAAFEDLSVESAVKVTGKVVENDHVKLGGPELFPERLEVVARAEAPLPIDEHRPRPAAGLALRGSTPSFARPFYHLRPAGDPTVTESFDLLWKGIEITTGRSVSTVTTCRRPRRGRRAWTSRRWPGYLNCFRYGCPPHGGSEWASTGS
jgi:aspartyl/asparaginyl-tRNA synthetase